MANGRRWTPEDTATLRRMKTAGYLNAEIARHMGRTNRATGEPDTAFIAKKCVEHQIESGRSAQHVAAVARINLRRMMARAE